MEKTLDFLVCLIAALALALAVYLVWKKKGDRDARYDERQLALRAAGYRRSFFVTLIAEAVALFLVEMEVIPLAAATLAVFVALLIGIVTFAVYCIVKDVFFRIGEKRTYYILLCAVIVVMDGITAATRIVSGTFLQNGVPTFESSSALVLALAFLVILIALLVRRDRGEDDE